MVQEPVECLFSFICSSNNNIGRIGGMLQALRASFGQRIPLHPYHGGGGGEMAEEAVEAALAAHLDEDPAYFTFPSVHAFAAATEEELRCAPYSSPYELPRAWLPWSVIIHTGLSLTKA